MKPSVLGRAGFYTTNAALAILFVFPFLWAGWASLRGRPGSGQASGFGFGNYTRFANFGAGISTFTFNSVAITVMAVGLTLVVSTLGGYAFGRFEFPARTCCSYSRWRS